LPEFESSDDFVIFFQIVTMPLSVSSVLARLFATQVFSLTSTERPQNFHLMMSSPCKSLSVSR